MASALGGFWSGFRALFGGLSRLSRLPKSYPFALVPTLVFALLEGGFLVLSVRLVAPWVRSGLSSQSWLPNFGASALSWLAVLLASVAGWFVAALLTPALSAPALERIVGMVEADLGAPAREPLGVWREFWCGLRSSAFGLLLFVPPVVLLTLLELVLPPVALVTTPLKLLLGALGIAWSLFDYPLTLRGVGAVERLGFLKAHAPSVLGFGCAFALTFWLPCCGIVLLPVGVAAATEHLIALERRTPPRLNPG
ncbi:MAG: EI24 domain-containing protein [Polyangiaceae bacterium]